jgi:hypothetical protein
MVHFHQYQTKSQTTIFSLINLQRQGIEITITNTNKKLDLKKITITAFLLPRPQSILKNKSSYGPV